MWQSNRTALCLTVLALTTLWCVGLFARGWWRPDEPREAALVQSMADHPDRMLPELSGRTFAEKPPLTYQLAAQSVEAWGMSPAASRLPQLLYAALAFASLVALTRAIAGEAAALAGGLTFATFALIYQTQVWLACDALTIAGVCLSLWGLYRGLTAVQSRTRLWGYLLMQLGLTLAFFAKNFAAWLVPISTLLVFLVWERRLRELLRWELWISGLIPAACIVFWVHHVAITRDGMEALRVLFWNNLAGRVMPVAAQARYTYTDAHHNWPGKYFIELPWYVLPWTAVAWAAARRAWKATRIPSPQRTAWRFAVCAVLPGLIILSLAATARGIYAAPCLAGVALLIALWAVDTEARSSLRASRSLALSGALVAFLSAIVFLATLALLFVTRPLGISAALGLVTCAMTFWISIRVPRSPIFSRTRALSRLGLAYALLLSFGALPLFRVVNHWQDLAEVAVGTQAALSHRPLVLWRPDETTLALSDLYLKEKPCRIFYADETSAKAGLEPLLSYLRTHPQAQVLALADKKRWPESRWVQYLRTGVVSHSAEAPLDFAPFAGRGDFQIDYSYEAPGGRRYVLLRHRA